MAGKFLIFAVFLAIFFSSCSAFVLNASRDEMLAYYQTYLEPKIPSSAKALIGDERINVQLGGKTLGIELKHGELTGFGIGAIDSPSIEVIVSDAAAEAIKGKREGMLDAINNGGITVKTNDFFTMIKVEMMKRIYAISGADDLITGKRAAPESNGIASYGSFYIQKATISG